MSRWLRRSSLLVRFFASWTLFQGTNAILLARPYTPSFVLKIALQDNNNNNMSSLPHQYQHHEPIDIEEREGRNDDESNHPNDTIVAANEPIWDPVAQIYNGGKVPENAAVPQMIQESNGYLRVFGYGSLCWNPGPAGESALAHSSVQRTTGQVRGYRRAWAQKSTDHRGLPQFPGIVCTLLTEAEFRKFRPPSACSPDADIEEAVTEGLIYKVPPDLVVECLEELDFREKGVSDITICTYESRTLESMEVYLLHTF